MVPWGERTQVDGTIDSCSGMRREGARGKRRDINESAGAIDADTPTHERPVTVMALTQTKYASTNLIG